MKLNREKIQRMMKGGQLLLGSGGSGSGGSGGGGGTSSYAEEAGHALEADHATSADSATEATHATSADTATSADSATTAQNLASDSSDWNKIADKTIAQSIAEVWTFAKGIISTLRSYFNGGATISKASGDTNKALQVAGGTLTDTLDVSGATTLGTTLNVTGNTTMGGTLGVTGKVTGNEAEFQTLAVTKSAHFQKLTVDELSSNKGAFIITSANCVAELVGEDQSAWFIYFSRTDRDGNAVTNPWKVGDQAICLTFKAEGTGTFDNVKNRYYWRMVTGVYSDQTGPDGNTYHVIHLSKTVGDSSGTTVPAAGDNIVQLGYQGQTSAPERQTAVILSSYPTMDSGVKPPSLAFYKNINGFALTNCRWTYIDGVNNEFIGNFKILVGNNYENLTAVLATIEGLIMTVQAMVRGKNILPSDGWTDYQGFLLGATNYDEQTQMFSNSDGEGSYDDMVWSPVFFLKAGTYTYSHYCSDPDVRLLVYGSSQQFTMGNLPLPELDDVTVYTMRSGDVYQSKQRRYATFTLANDAYVCLNIYLGDGEFTMYRPMLEEGSICSDWETGTLEHTSQVKILANAINLSIRAGLQTTGINITTGEVAVEADKFTVEKNGVQVFGVDSNTGVTTMQDVDIKGSLVYHKTLIDRSNNYYQLFEMFDVNGNVVGLDYSGIVHKTVLKYDTIVIGGVERTAGYNLFNGVTEYGYTIILPPAKLFQGMRIKIINGTVNSLSGQPAQQQLSKINFAVVYRSDTDTYDEESGTGYAMNNVASVTPVSFEMNSSQGVGTFVGAPQGNTFIRDYTPSTAEHFTCYGLSGDNSQSNPVRYKSFELVSKENPYTSSGYAWTIIELNQ